MRIDEVIQQPGQKERALKNDILRSLHVALPGEIVTYDSETRTATIQPTLREWDSKEDPPLLTDVPVFMWGNYTFSPSKGDGCLVVFADGGIDSWLQSGGVSSPMTSRKHSMSDGFAFVGFRGSGSNSLSDLLNSKVPKTDIVDNLTTNDATKVLSAKQGKALSDQIAKKVNPSEIAIVIDGNACTSGASVGQYVTVRNSSGISDGVYIVAHTIPANTTEITPWYLTSISSGAINSLNGQIASKSQNLASSFNVHRWGKLVFLSCVGGTYSKDSNNHITTTTGTPIVVPSGYRPISQAELWDTNGQKRIIVNTDGTIDSTVAVSNSSLRFSGCWITSDTMPT